MGGCTRQILPAAQEDSSWTTRRAGYPSNPESPGEICVALGQRALEQDLVRPVRVREHAEEDDVQQALAPRRLLDGNVAVQPRHLRSVMVPLADDL